MKISKKLLRRWMNEFYGPMTDGFAKMRSPTPRLDAIKAKARKKLREK